METTIVRERADSDDAVQLITELEAHLDPLYPSESRHGFSVEKLLRDHVAFFVVRQEDVAAGCGGVKLFGTDYGELSACTCDPRFAGREWRA